MKKLLNLFLIIALLIVGCSKPEFIDNGPTFNEELSAFVATKATDPLEGTIWHHVTGDTYDKYLYFNEDEVNMFYGKYSDEEGLERWSDFYTAPYNLNEGVVITDLTYPHYGEREYTEKLNVIKSLGVNEELVFIIQGGDDVYTYWGNDASTLEWQWITIIVTINDWGEDGEDEHNGKLPWEW